MTLYNKQFSRRKLLNEFPRHSIGAEIGVFRGDFSKEIIEFVQPDLLFLIDPWINRTEPSYKDTWYSATSGNDMTDIYIDVTMKFSFGIIDGTVKIIKRPSLDALSCMSDNSLDWVYIDGDHHYMNVLKDLEMARLKVKTGGIICGDDYINFGWFKDDVIRAVNEFSIKYHCPIHIIDYQFLMINQ